MHFSKAYMEKQTEVQAIEESLEQERQTVAQLHSEIATLNSSLQERYDYADLKAQLAGKPSNFRYLLLQKPNPSCLLLTRRCLLSL